MTKKERNAEIVEMAKTMHYTDIAKALNMGSRNVYDILRTNNKYWRQSRDQKPESTNKSLAEHNA